MQLLLQQTLKILKTLGKTKQSRINKKELALLKTC